MDEDPNEGFHPHAQSNSVVEYIIVDILETKVGRIRVSSSGKVNLRRQ